MVAAAWVVGYIKGVKEELVPKLVTEVAQVKVEEAPKLEDEAQLGEMDTLGIRCFVHDPP